MRRITSIWLLFVFLLPISSTYISFKFRQHHIRKEIKRQLKSGVNEDKLVLLKIPVSKEVSPGKDFKRMHEREFRYKGNMYDIVKQEKRGEITWYWCIWDKQETALFVQLDQMVDRAMRNSPTQQANDKLLEQFLDSLYYTEITLKLNLPLQNPSQPNTYFSEKEVIVTTSPPTPPPKA
ncbi:hypothetical protein ACFSKU_12685 [Pontibacter silvestris]|uniref:Uncharacterized protein n=1 Tax=Pontibacter silvestris TaxID=2305183 RepID=A0ABW4WYN9_9BACT|nr:hypothetical protein [Pontibacter silvestris]MCC9138432.1 hypothetical protein [Pontibacter silvestris]